MSVEVVVRYFDFFLMLRKTGEHLCKFYLLCQRRFADGGGCVEI